MENLLDTSDWSDAQLLSTAVRYGEEARNWRNKFLGLLPEIQRRKLYEKQGCPSIFVFAFKIGGVSEEQVRTVLNLERRFEDKPALHKALISGEVSANKLARVASIATIENAEELTNRAKVLPQNALETYVRDVKIAQSGDCQNTEIFSQSLRAQTFQLAPEVQEKLEELHLKGIDINEIILRAIQEREERIAQEKENIAEECEKTSSRYIPARTRKIITQEHGTKCSITTCSNPSQNIHHTQRFSISKTHDPHYLAPLCKGHHVLAHLADQVYARKIRRNR
ncbi:MAG: hypothetical protein WC101_02275 [Candidatus Gracilibacteria bacterium]